jgi:hypothetical protein
MAVLVEVDDQSFGMEPVSRDRDGIVKAKVRLEERCQQLRSARNLPEDLKALPAGLEPLRPHRL